MRLRIGVTTDPDGVRRALGPHVHADLLTVPDDVHLLVVPAAALTHAARVGTRALVVVALADGTDVTEVAEEARGALGAAVVVVGPPRGARPGAGPADTDLARVVGALVDRLGRGAPLGAALEQALVAYEVVAGDGTAVRWVDLGALLDPEGGRGAGAEPETAAPDAGAEPPPPPPPSAPPGPPPPAPVPPPAAGRPPTAARPRPAAPTGEPDDRWLQCRVDAGHDAVPASQPGPPNTFVKGTNVVTVFVGPLEEGALAAGSLTAHELGFTRPHVTSVRLTAVLVPLEPHGTPSQAQLRVPRHGRSTDARLELHVPPGAREVSARVLLLHRNRVLQTAVLTGVVGGPATLAEYALIHPTLADLRRRRAFDAAVVANHDAAGRPGLMAHGDGTTTSVDVPAMRELEPVVEHLRELLVRAASLPARRAGTPSAAEVALLVELAVWGRDLHAFLETYLLPFARTAPVERLQVVTARTGVFLPLELAYTRPAPDDGAALCPSWLAGGAGCGPSCGTGPDDTTIVCPSAFLGLRATVERHYVDAVPDGLGGGDPGRQVLTTATPTRRRRRLAVTRAALGASRKVADGDVTATLAVLGDGAGRARTWEEWATLLAAADTDLLVLMPHTDVPRATLEISAQTLVRGRIEARHVTGGRDVRPVVVLLGCDTAGSADDPAGFATRFLARDAAVVVSSLTMLRAAHAALLAQRLVTALRAAAGDRRRAPLGDLVTAWRRAAVADGLPAALALTAYGDADWTI